MMHNPLEQHRLPFLIQDDFLETAFERRFQRLLRHAWQKMTRIYPIRSNLDVKNFTPGLGNQACLLLIFFPSLM